MKHELSMNVYFLEATYKSFSVSMDLRKILNTFHGQKFSSVVHTCCYKSLHWLQLSILVSINHRQGYSRISLWTNNTMFAIMVQDLEPYHGRCTICSRVHSNHWWCSHIIPNILLVSTNSMRSVVRIVSWVPQKYSYIAYYKFL